MILVTVGTEQFPFNRLMKWIQVLIDREFLQATDLVVQYGSCTIVPAGVQSHSILAQAQFQSLVQRANLIISHCGEGTLLLLDTLQKPYILVPRSKRFQEHVDDHQVELANALAQRQVPIAWSPGDLVRLLAAPQWVPPVTASTALLCQGLKRRFG
jgi:UDP-N-acetylglucosamine transferase subunit ALG13